MSEIIRAFERERGKQERERELNSKEQMASVKRGSVMRVCAISKATFICKKSIPVHSF